MDADDLKFLDKDFLKAMNDIGRLGYEKYGAHSFYCLSQAGTGRAGMKRCQSSEIAAHATKHLSEYLENRPHDVFGTEIHQLAAAAFNAMMESYFLKTDVSK